MWVYVTYNDATSEHDLDVQGPFDAKQVAEYIKLILDTYRDVATSFMITIT